jgi:beta-lactam-binding protein with PASTA domain
LETIALREHNDTILAGFVIAQVPLEGTEMKRGEQALLRISLGSGMIQMPNVIGLTQDMAEHELASCGVGVSDVLIELSEAPIGQVINQYPLPGTDAENGILADLHISGGLVVVPDLSSQTFALAEKTLLELGLEVGAVSYVDVNNARLDTLVLTQDPKVGTHVFPGVEVHLSMGRFDSRPYRNTVVVRLHVPETGAGVRVTLIEPDGAESEQYAAKHTITGLNEIVVELRSAIGGIMKYRVYLDERLVDEKELTFE